MSFFFLNNKIIPGDFVCGGFTQHTVTFSQKWNLPRVDLQLGELAHFAQKVDGIAKMKYKWLLENIHN